MNRPLGVTILAWLAIISGVISLFAAIAAVMAFVGALALGGAFMGAGALPGGASIAFASITGMVMSIWLGILGAVSLAYGVGALGLKPWAWSIGVIWCYVAAISDVVSIFTSRGSNVLSAIIGILFSIAILYYLYTDEVRNAFGKSDKAAPSFLEPIFLQINNVLANRGGSAQPPQSPGGYPPSGGSGGGGYQSPQAPAHYEEQRQQEPPIQS